MYNSHWRTDYIDISAYGGSDVLIRFESRNRQGNNLFLDNIWVYQGVEPVAVEENKLLNEVKIYPNPSNNTLTLELGTNSLTNASYQLIDMTGRIVKANTIYQNRTFINVADLTNGIYFVNVVNEHGNKVLKLVKN